MTPWTLSELKGIFHERKSYLRSGRHGLLNNAIADYTSYFHIVVLKSMTKEIY